MLELGQEYEVSMVIGCHATRLYAKSFDDLTHKAIRWAIWHSDDLHKETYWFNDEFDMDVNVRKIKSGGKLGKKKRITICLSMYVKVEDN